MKKYIRANPDTDPYTSITKATSSLVSLWDLIGEERPDKPGKMLELEANSEMNIPSYAEREIKWDSGKEGTPIVEVDLTADSPEESSSEINVVTGK